MAQIIWTPKALEDLEYLLNYIAKDSPIAAQRFAHKLIDRVDVLNNQPLLGSYIAEDNTHTYRQVIQGNYRIIYRTDEKTIFILTVHHAARLLDSDNLR
jgi:toxin ParE1/3/4